MNHKTQIGFLIILLAAIVATLAFVIGPAIYANNQQTTTASQAAPDQVVKDFYAWYLGYIGDRSTGNFRNPLVDKAYRSSDALAQEFVARLDVFTAGGMMFDPILCAQDVPTSISTGAPAVAGSSATVRVETSFAGHAFDVRLTQAGGGWKIADVICAPR